LNHNNVVTPNQRSLPKYKNMFGPPRAKSGKKDISGKRNSYARVVAQPKKDNISPPHRPHRSNKALRF
jgi:hypothetical protein